MPQAMSCTLNPLGQSLQVSLRTQRWNNERGHAEPGIGSLEFEEQV
jgi:hypothetical protein